MADLIRGLATEPLRARLEKVRSQISSAAGGRKVEVLAAVKYIPIEELEVLAEAGFRLLGENRAQDLVAKAEAYAGRFTWDFIGHLQSRKVRQVVPYVRCIHSVSSHSALEQLGRHALPETRILIEVNVAGEEGKTGITPDELPEFLERSPVPVRGTDDNAAAGRRPGAEPFTFWSPTGAGWSARPGGAFDGHEPGLPGRSAGGGDHRAPRQHAVSP